MQGAPQFAGTVIDAASGKPLRGFKVKWGDSYDGNSVFDSPDGRFKVQLDDMRFLDQKQYDVKVSAEGYVSEEKKLTTTETPKADYSVVFALARPFPIVGRITDSAGKGIAGAKVLVIEKGGYIYYQVPPKVSEMAYQLTAVTGPDGRFSIPQARERNAMVMVEKAGFCKIIRESVDLAKPVNLTLPLPASVEVKAQEIAAGQSLQAGLKATVDLDAKGQVTVRGVVRRGGEPVEGVAVEVYRDQYDRDSCGTDRDGKFEIEFDKRGEADISCRVDGQGRSCASRKDQLKAGENTINFDLPNGRISGRVVDAKSGAPMAGETVQALVRWSEPTRRYFHGAYPQFWAGATAASAVPADDGSFELRGVPGGEVALVVAQRDRSSKHLQGPMKLDEKKPLDGVTLRVREKGTLALTVVDAQTGKPIEGAGLYVATPEGVLLPDPFNWESAVQVPAGSYLLWVEPEDSRHMPAGSKVEIKPHQTAKVRFKLPPVEQRIVFDVPKGSKFGKLQWTRLPADQPWPARLAPCGEDGCSVAIRTGSLQCRSGRAGTSSMRS